MRPARIFSIRTLVNIITNLMKNNTLAKIKEDPRINDDKHVDNNNINLILQITYVLRIFKMISIILTVCFFLG